MYFKVPLGKACLNTSLLPRSYLGVQLCMHGELSMTFAHALCVEKVMFQVHTMYAYMHVDM